MLDETQVIKAVDIVENPDDVYYLIEPYIIVSDQSMRGTFSNLVSAVNLLYHAGYRVITQSSNDSGMMLLTLEKTDYKSKNDNLRTNQEG